LKQVYTMMRGQKNIRLFTVISRQACRMLNKPLDE